MNKEKCESENAFNVGTKKCVDTQTPTRIAGKRHKTVTSESSRI